MTKAHAGHEQSEAGVIGVRAVRAIGSRQAHFLVPREAIHHIVRGHRGDYNAERYNPTLAACTTLSLTFDGSKLTLTDGKKIDSYRAVSGRAASTGKFDYSSARQRVHGAGPIPEGIYWINPLELWENAWWKPAPTRAWGNFRITIHPFNTTVTFGRGGFFIHGGSVPGSAGCICLTTDIDHVRSI